jgi:hypothetical protein
MADIGDGDQHDMTAGNWRHRHQVPAQTGIVMIAGIGRIDGDQRNGAQIGSSARIDLAWPPWLLDHRFGKFGRECRGREWRSG